MSEHWWFRPLAEWVDSDRRDRLQADIVGGLTTGAVIIPKAMAYAMMAGLPVQVRLYTALVPMVIYAVLGTSRVLSVSTTTTLAILTAAQLGQVVLVGTMKGIVVAIIVSLVTLAHQVADPPVYVLRRKPGTNVFRPQSPRTHEFA